jgi:hypothetical protein
MADMYTYSDSAWPNAYLAGFDKMGPKLAAASLLDFFAFTPLVKESELEAFEQFVFKAWDADPSVVPGRAGYTADGRGVFEFSKDRTYRQRVNGTAADFPFFLPVTQELGSDGNTFLGLDVLAFAPDAVNRTLECVEQV